MQNPKLYDQECCRVEEFLHTSTEIKQIVRKSLELAVTLTLPYSLNDYTEVYSSFLIYIRILHRTLSNKTNFSQEKLQAGYFYSLQHRLALPRLYISMIIACLLDDTSYLKSVCAMFPSVSHPLRGLMLRFTAITFFPHDSDILVPFTVTNFNEMMYLIKGFLELYPDEITTAAEWIASNISISLTIVSDSILINHYIDEAISCQFDELGAASINSVVLSIPKHSFEQYLPKLKTFFLKAPINETNIKSVAEIIANVENSKTAYNFVSSIHYNEQCVVNLAAAALNEKDYDTLSKLEQTDDVLMLILTEAGPEIFADLAKPFERGNPLSKEFTKLLRPNVNPVKARRILQNEIENMDPELYDIIADVIQYYSFPKEFFEVFFAPPFTFQTSNFLIFVVLRGLEMGIKTDLLMGYIRVSKSVSAASRAATMCAVSHGPELVFYCLGLENETARKILMSKIDKTYPEPLILKILEKCETTDEITMLFQTSIQFGDKSLTGKILETLLEKDGEIESNEELLNFYFVNILNNLFAASESVIPISQDFMTTIINQISTAVDVAAGILFPITTPKTQRIWMNIVSYGIKLKTMEQYSDVLKAVNEQISKFV